MHHDGRAEDRWYETSQAMVSEWADTMGRPIRFSEFATNPLSQDRGCATALQSTIYAEARIYSLWPGVLS